MREQGMEVVSEIELDHLEDGSVDFGSKYLKFKSWN